MTTRYHPSRYSHNGSTTRDVGNNDSPRADGCSLTDCDEVLRSEACVPDDLGAGGDSDVVLKHRFRPEGHQLIDPAVSADALGCDDRCKAMLNEEAWADAITVNKKSLLRSIQ